MRDHTHALLFVCMFSLLHWTVDALRELFMHLHLISALFIERKSGVNFLFIMSSGCTLGADWFTLLCWFLLYKWDAAMLCCPQSPSCLLLFATPWTVPCQAPLSMGILQSGILEWVAIPSSRGSSRPRNRTRVSCIAGRFFTN